MRKTPIDLTRIAPSDVTGGTLQPEDHIIRMIWPDSSLFGNDPSITIIPSDTQTLFPDDTPLIECLHQAVVHGGYFEATLLGLAMQDPKQIYDCLCDNNDGTVTARIYVIEKDEAAGQYFIEQRYVIVDKTNFSSPQLNIKFSSPLCIALLKKAYISSLISQASKAREAPLPFSEYLQQKFSNNLLTALTGQPNLLDSQQFVISPPQGALQIPASARLDEVRDVQFNPGNNLRFEKIVGTLFPSDGAPLSYQDVRQGKLGDCYFDAALMAILYNDPRQIYNYMIERGDNEVIVRVFIRNQGVLEPHYCILDKTDFLPQDSSQEAFHHHAPYVIMLEKAYAAALFLEELLNNSRAQPKSLIEYLHSGSSSKVILTLTGNNCEIINLEASVVSNIYLKQLHDKDFFSECFGYSQKDMYKILNYLVGVLNKISCMGTDFFKSKEAEKYAPTLGRFFPQLEEYFSQPQHDVASSCPILLGYVKKLLLAVPKFSYEKPIYLDFEIKPDEVPPFLYDFYLALHKLLCVAASFQPEAQTLSDKPHYEFFHQEIYFKIREALADRNFVIAGTKSFSSNKRATKHAGEFQSQGLVATHAYGVLRAYQRATGHLFIELWNPWHSYGAKYIRDRQEMGTVIRREAEEKRDTESPLAAFGPTLDSYSAEPRPGTFELEMTDFARHVVDIMIVEGSEKLSVLLNEVQQLLELFLGKLPEGEIKDGLAEVTKMFRLKSSWLSDEEFIKTLFLKLHAHEKVSVRPINIIEYLFVSTIQQVIKKLEFDQTYFRIFNECHIQDVQEILAAAKRNIYDLKKSPQELIVELCQDKNLFVEILLKKIKKERKFPKIETVLIHLYSYLSSLGKPPYEKLQQLEDCWNHEITLLSYQQKAGLISIEKYHRCVDAYHFCQSFCQLLNDFYGRVNERFTQAARQGENTNILNKNRRKLFEKVYQLIMNLSLDHAKPDMIQAIIPKLSDIEKRFAPHAKTVTASSSARSETEFSSEPESKNSASAKSKKDSALTSSSATLFAHCDGQVSDVDSSQDFPAP